LPETYWLMIVTSYCMEYFRPPVLFNYLDLVKGGDCPDGRIRYYSVENGTQLASQAHLGEAVSSNGVAEAPVGNIVKYEW